MPMPFFKFTHLKLSVFSHALAARLLGPGSRRSDSQSCMERATSFYMPRHHLKALSIPVTGYPAPATQQPVPVKRHLSDRALKNVLKEKK